MNATAEPRRSARVAAAIATRNRPAGLARCVDALLAGGMLPAEIIIVDQSATPWLLGAAAAPTGTPMPIRYIRQAPMGLSASRNAAMRATGYSVLAMTDDDCVPDAGWVAAIDAAFEAAPDSAAVTGRVLPLGSERPGFYAVSLRTNATRHTYTGRAIPWLVGSGGSTAVAIEWCQRIGGFDERLGAGSPGRSAEDADLLHRLLKAGGTIVYEPSAIVFHERQPWAARLASRTGYGHGIGAFAGISLRRHDGFACRCFAGWLASQSLRFAAALAQRDWALARQRQSSLAGAVHGFFYGLRVPERLP